MTELPTVRYRTLDSEERKKDVDVEIYLTQGGQGLHRIKLGSTGQIFALGERCFKKLANEHVFAPDHWKITAMRGHVSVQLAAPGSCGWQWSLEFQNGNFSASRKDMQ